MSHSVWISRTSKWCSTIWNDATNRIQCRTKFFTKRCIKIYPCRYPLVTPYTRRQLNLHPPHIRRKCRKLNRLITHYRVKVEHAICDIERYRVIGTLWRHPRRKMKKIVELWCICETSTNSVLSINIVQIWLHSWIF